ncbi:putative outer membrane hemolysin activator protein [Burkholderia pseudomallei]|uniref:Outer membrane hemolysin activator protein n=1 Tax=Burkholderia pseudomallei TaxID=28450 RepID=A0AA40JIS0_BURPE|nr:putative outer membrane hemolysin activator protein [Burkholderia pseudomallei]
MRIAPGDMPGESDVVLDVKRGKPWTVVRVRFDNFPARARPANCRATYRFLASTTRLGLNDIFFFNVSAFSTRILGIFRR